MFNLQRLSVIAFVVIFCFSSFIQANIVGDVFCTLYAGVSSLSRSVSDYSRQVYAQRVKRKVAACTNTIVKKCQLISTEAQKISANVAEAESFLPTIRDVVITLSREHSAFIEPKLAELEALSKKIKKDAGKYMPKNEEDARNILQEVSTYLEDLSVRELSINSEVTFLEKFKYYLFSLINVPIRLVVWLIAFLISSGWAFAFMSFIVTLLSVYYAFKKTLSFLKLIWFFVKVPVRLIRAVCVFIWRLIFGFPDNHFDFQVSENMIEEECGCTCANHKKKSGSPGKKEDESSNRKEGKAPSKASNKKFTPNKKSSHSAHFVSLSSSAISSSDSQDFSRKAKESGAAEESQRTHGSTVSDSFAVTSSLSMLVGVIAFML